MDIIFGSIVYNEPMNKSHNSQYRQYGKYSMFAVVLSLFLLPSFASAHGVEDKSIGQEHWSNVAKVVKELRKVAGQPSIGDEVRQVAQDEEDSAKEVEQAIDKVEKIGKFRTVFIGTDYKNLGALRSELVKTQNAIDRLTKAMERTTDVNAKSNLQKQIDELKVIQTKVETFIKDHEGQFSFLGWFVKLFN